jgi:uncharacterized repeat protein (TIGR02543 family)
MKKSIKLIICALMCFSIITIPINHSSVYAEENTLTSGKCGDNLTWSYDESEECLYIDGYGNMYDFDWGTETPFEPLTETTDDDVPWATLNYRTVVIGDYVTSIGNCAFTFSDLQYLCWDPDAMNVTRVGNYAFSKTKLCYFGEMPKLEEIGNSAFSNCYFLNEIKLPNSLKKIGNSAFVDLYDEQILDSGITVPNSVKEIGINAFGDTKINVEYGSYAYEYACKNKLSYTLTNNPTFAIKYELNGGKNNSNNPNSYKLSTATINLSNPTRKGYTFKGWYSDSKLTNKVTSIKKGSTGNKTLYAKWTPTTYKITYKLNKGTNNKSNPSTYKITTSTITLKNPTRKGYTFSGWYSDSKFKNKVTKITKSSTGNKTLYAKWAKVSVKKANAPTLKNVKGSKLKVTYKAVKGVKGYEIQYSTDKNFKKSVKTITTSKTTYTISKLTKKKTYYVRVRAYKADSANKKVYGSYSSVKKLKITK